MGSNSNFENYQKGPLGAEAFGRSSRVVTKTSVALSFQDQARFLVKDYLEPILNKSNESVMLEDDQVYVVWFSKTLENWKALVSTTLPDGKYYEVTHNGAKNETYVDVYVKIDNFCVPDEA